jgi:S1-C subfamily serine protease
MESAEFPSTDLESRRQMHMSDTWPPSTDPEDADNVKAAPAGDGAHGADGPTGPVANDTAQNDTVRNDTAQQPIPLGPPLIPGPPQYWREYPYAGGPDGGASPQPDGLYRPQTLYPSGYPTQGGPPAGPESSAYPPPPPGVWPSTPYPGWSAEVPGGGPVPGGWSGGAGGAVPPYGAWSLPGYPPPSQAARPKKRGALAIGAAAVLGMVAILAGAGLGHYIWPSSAPSAASSNNLTPQGSSGSGSPYSGNGSSSPYGGSSGNYSPFGGSSGSGGSSTGAGAPSDISAIAAKVDPALVDINTNLSYEDEQAAGTGMVLTSDGEILTNNHVIDGATSISATDVGNGKTYKATVVGYDRTGDVAVIKLTGASGLSTVSIASRSAAVGQAVVGVGNAGGTGGTPSSAGGSVTAVGQSITASDDGGGNAESLTGLIETNAGIKPGDSGGSLVNTEGKVLGMDTAASADSEYDGSGSQGYAIPIDTALSIVHRIEAGDASSTVHIGATGFLGVSIASSSSSSGLFGGSGSVGSGSSGSTQGADVQGTLSGSPAAQAGLVQGDVITGVDSHQVGSSSDLSNIMEQYHPGDTVQLQWANASGQTQTASVTLESGPPS